jgi:hypothetical protein
MSDNSIFKSREGKLTCTPRELFDFATDIRNLQQFIPASAGIKDLNIEKESCSFTIPSMGRINIHLSEKEPFRRVTYSGTLFQENDFSLSMDIDKSPEGKAEVILTVSAYMNPFLRMMVAGSVQTFLEKMIGEMEKFNSWNRINE